MVLVAALASALAYAVAMVLQQRSARTVPAAASLRPDLVVELLRRRVWLVGIGCNLAAFGLRGLALSAGSLAVVQPVVLLGLLFALLIEARSERRALTSREAAGSLALVVGLATFVLAAAPGPGRTDVPAVDWLVLAAVVGGAALPAVAWASRRTGERRASGLALAGALLLALTTALTKQVADDVAAHGTGAATSWAPYALLVVGALAVLVTQSALQAGPLRASLPVISVVEPLTSVLVGAWVFREQLATSAVARAGELSGLLLLGLGAVLLTTRPTPAPAPVPPVPLPVPAPAAAPRPLPVPVPGPLGTPGRRR
jgi:hypothetical protein